MQEIITVNGQDYSVETVMRLTQEQRTNIINQLNSNMSLNNINTLDYIPSVGSSSCTATLAAQLTITTTTGYCATGISAILNFNVNSGSAVSGATVTLSGAATGTGTTDASGNVNITTTATSTGTITATASKTNYTSGTTTVTVTVAPSATVIPVLTCPTNVTVGSTITVSANIRNTGAIGNQTFVLQGSAQTTPGGTALPLSNVAGNPISTQTANISLAIGATSTTPLVLQYIMPSSDVLVSWNIKADPGFPLF